MDHIWKYYSWNKWCPQAAREANAYLADDLLNKHFIQHFIKLKTV